MPPYDDYQVMAGQGTCALELLEEVPGSRLPADTVQRRRIICRHERRWSRDQSGNFAALPSSRLAVTTPRRSFIQGERVTIPPPQTIADGLRVQIPGALTFPYCA